MPCCIAHFAYISITQAYQTVFFCDFQLHLKAFVLRSQSRQLHLFCRNALRPGPIQLAGLESLQPVAQGLRRHTQLAGYSAHALPALDSLHGGFLELCRVHLVRYLEHLCFPSFGSSLYTTCWKAKFQGKLTFHINYIHLTQILQLF
ncbi:hypothetical protein WJ88_00450 [Burkholderia ubonensis]|nr:hypothetical protein WJ88_00450 [Burkholderia ubonensis]